MNNREELYRAAISCRHEITHDQIILYVDSRKEGNALSQLADRLEQAALASQAQQTESKLAFYVDAATLRGMMLSYNTGNGYISWRTGDSVNESDVALYVIPPAPEVCSDGGKCGAGGYCITCPNMPAPEGDKL